jgi:hypothetical protein
MAACQVNGSGLGFVGAATSASTARRRLGRPAHWCGCARRSPAAARVRPSAARLFRFRKAASGSRLVRPVAWGSTWFCGRVGWGHSRGLQPIGFRARARSGALCAVGSWGSRWRGSQGSFRATVQPGIRCVLAGRVARLRLQRGLTPPRGLEG